MGLGKYIFETIKNDRATKIVVPNLEFFVTSAITDLVSDFSFNRDDPSERRLGGFFGEPEIEESPFTVRNALNRIFNAFTIGLGVTEIESINEYVMPMSKGIGSNGEVIHLLGARNEIVKISFVTDEYGGSLGIPFKMMLQTIMNDAIVVYLLDDMYSAMPCLVRNFKMKKTAEYQNVIMGEMELVVIAREREFIKNIGKKIGSSISSAVSGIVSWAGAGLTFVSGASATEPVSGAVQDLGNFAQDIFGSR